MQQLYSTSREAVAAQLCSTQASGSLWKIAVITAEISRLIVWKVIFLLCTTWNVLTLLLNSKFSFSCSTSSCPHLCTMRTTRVSAQSSPQYGSYFLNKRQDTTVTGSCNSQRKIFRPLCFCFHADNHKLLSRIVVVVVSFLLIYCKCRAAAAARREEGNIVQAERKERGRKSLSWQ